MCFPRKSKLHDIFAHLLSLRLKGVETLKYRCVCWSLFENFNIVSNDHGLTQKCDFCVSVFKINFTDHHTPHTISTFRDSVLICKMHVCYCMIQNNFEHFHSFSSFLLINWCKRQAIAMVRLYANKTIQNAFRRIYYYIYWFNFYSISSILLLKNTLTSIFSKISKIEWICEWFNLMKSSGKYKRWEEADFTLHRQLKSPEIGGCTRPF